MDMKSILFYNCRIYSMITPDDVYYGMIIKGSKIEKLLKNLDDISGYEIDERIDLECATVFPGFIDSHVHLTQTGLNFVGVQLNSVTNAKMMLDSIDFYSLRLENENIVFGTGYDELNMEGNLLPSMKELDDILPKRFLWLSRVDSHSCLVNTSFLNSLNLSDDIIGVDLDSEGKPTGVLRDVANSIARKAALDLVSDESRNKGIMLAIDKAVEKGITAIHALEGGPLFSDLDYYFIEKYAKTSRIYIEPHFQIMNTDIAEELDLKRLGGCIILDGSFGSRTAALFEPYSDDPSTNGSLYIDTVELEEFVMKATEKNIQVAFHALGERAIDQVLNAYLKAHNRYPDKHLRHRIEHFELPLNQHIKLAAELGVVISVQPAFDYYWGGTESMYYDRLGSERAKRTIPLKSILDSGCVMVGGSDSDVTPIDPIIGIHGAVNHSNENESISVYEAIRMFTYNGAYTIGLEDEMGTLQEGKIANFVVLDRDLLRIPSNELDKSIVLKTYSKGIKVFENKN